MGQAGQLGYHHFYPRPPRGGRPAPHATAAPTAKNFYPRPPRGGRRFNHYQRNSCTTISIHALREEGDLWAICSRSARVPFLSTPSARRATYLLKVIKYNLDNFYPRPPRGGRPRPPSFVSRSRIFLSTPSARRATRDSFLHCLHHLDFYPRPPRGGRRGARREVWRQYIFLSTPSARRATHENGGHLRSHPISIHALREEGDNIR